MPLDHYGVLVGVLRSHRRDQPDTQGRWYHVNLQVEAAGGDYRCAIDVDSKQSATGVEWQLLTLPAAAVAPVDGLPAGYHELERAAGSGALDLIRSPALADCPRWSSGSNVEATIALESILVLEEKVLIWGEPFSSGLGMHNIHQNQGDPRGSQWSGENGIWQDGATMVERPDGALDVFISKFSTQASQTDDAGHPV